MEVVANKIFNATPANVSFNGERMTPDKLDQLVLDEINKLPEDVRKTITKKERQQIADQILDSWMDIALESDKRALEENAANAHLNYYDATHDINVNDQIYGDNADDTPINPYLYWMNQ